MLLLIVTRKEKALHRPTFRKMARLAAEPPGSLRVTSQVSSSRRPLDPPDIGSFTIEPRLSHGRGALEESGMNRLTLEERRRVYLAQRRAQERMLVRPQPETIEAFAPRSDPRRLRWIAVAAMIAAALGGGLLAAPTLEFHPLESLVGALLPRL